jgi:hypothetical protein
MREKNGFTVMEMIVGSAVLLVVIVITMTFFRHQSRFGGELRKDMGNKETVALAMMLMRRDLIQAGSGLADNHPLGLWVDGYYSNFYHKLYVNYGYYLKMMPSTKVLPVNQSVYEAAFFLPAGLNPSNTLTLPATQRYDVGCALTYTQSSNTWGTVALSGVPVENSDGSATFVFSSFPASDTPFVPAISYKLIDTDTNNDTPPYAAAAYPELQRNGQRIAGGKKEPFLKFTDFSIRCQFVNSLDGTTNWSPSVSNDFASYPFDNLKMVEITLGYKTITPGQDPSVASNWKAAVSKVFTISPRNIFMMTNIK